MKINKNKFWLSAFILLFILTFQSCMETVEPAKTNKIKLKTKALKIIDNNSKQIETLRGVEIKVNDINDKNQNQQLITNTNGVADFDFEIPVFGKSFAISANYNNDIQSIPFVHICKDTILNFLFRESHDAIECGENISDTLIFYDDQGSARLQKNTPANINEYHACYTIHVKPDLQGKMTINIPSFNNPNFKMESIMLNGENIPLRSTDFKLELTSGSSLTICFSVSTLETGLFEDFVSFSTECDNGNKGVYNLNLMAEIVEPACDCQDINGDKQFELEERVPLGNNFEFKNLEAFVNNTPCTVEISLDSTNNNNDWQITSPKFSLSLKSGEKLLISGIFTPSSPSESLDILYLDIHPEGTNNHCPLVVAIEGNGCDNSCPYISVGNNFSYELFGAKSPIQDLVSNRSDDKVFISVPSILSVASESYYIKNSDSSCSETSITVDVIPNDNYAKQYFSVSPTQITLQPGESVPLNVMFTAPTLNELDAILKQRKGNGPYSLADSSFGIKLIISGSNCSQELDISSIVTAFPDISPIINLRAYNQSTPQKPSPENEVYIFGDASRKILKSPDGSNGPYPPNLGDIWIDVNDNNQGASPPQEPILKLVDNSIEVKLWKSNYAESLFSDVPSLVTEFANDPAYNIGYGSGPITGMKVNDVYAFKFNSNTYALIFIRRVDDGSENTSSKQSGIEFRAVYPIYIY